MKYSKFNSFIPLSKKTGLIYNAYSNRFLLVRKELLNLPDVAYLQENNKELYSKLMESKCIVEDDADELEWVKKRQQNADNNLTDYHLIINPTLDCNFKCWYCYETHIRKSKISTDTYERIEKLISQKIDKSIKRFNLSFFGGEPLLQYNLVDSLMSYTKSLCEKNEVKLNISFTTNGYLLNEEKIAKLAAYGVNSMQITLDGNKEQHDKVRYPSSKLGSYERIVYNVKLLLKYGIYVVLRINYTTENISGTKDIINDFTSIDEQSKCNLNIQLHRVWQDDKGENIDEEVKELIELLNSEKLKAYKFPLDNVISSCYGDKLNEALINYNGDVYRCTAVNFSKNKRDGYLNENGDVVWEDDSFEIRKNAKFKNKPCLECRLLPICNGGCAQKALEYQDNDYCIFDFDENKKDTAVIEKLQYYMKYTPNFSFQ